MKIIFCLHIDTHNWDNGYRLLKQGRFLLIFAFLAITSCEMPSIIRLTAMLTFPIKTKPVPVYVDVWDRIRASYSNRQVMMKKHLDTLMLALPYISA